MTEKETRREFMRKLGTLGLAGMGLVGLERLVRKMVNSSHHLEAQRKDPCNYTCGYETCDGNLSGYHCPAPGKQRFDCTQHFTCEGTPGDFTCKVDRFNCLGIFKCVEEIWGRQFHHVCAVTVGVTSAVAIPIAPPES